MRKVVTFVKANQSKWRQVHREHVHSSNGLHLGMSWHPHCTSGMYAHQYNNTCTTVVPPSITYNSSITYHIPCTGATYLGVCFVQRFQALGFFVFCLRLTWSISIAARITSSPLGLKGASFSPMKPLPSSIRTSNNPGINSTCYLVLVETEFYRQTNNENKYAKTCC